jgi:hypothetical protein
MLVIIVDLDEDNQRLGPWHPWGADDASAGGVATGGSLRRPWCWGVIRLQRIYNFLCSMLVFTPFAYCFITLRGTFMHFLELTY